MVHGCSHFVKSKGSKPPPLEHVQEGPLQNLAKGLTRQLQQQHQDLGQGGQPPPAAAPDFGRGESTPPLQQVNFGPTFGRLTLGRLWDDFASTFGPGKFWSTLGQLLADFGSALGQLLVDFWPTFGQLLADFWPTFGRLLTDF